MTKMECPLCRDGYKKNADGNHEALDFVWPCALIAAAKVGEPTTEYAEGTIGWSMAVKQLQDNATIERCAQVAEGYRGTTGWAVEDRIGIAAAIRALKDKP